MNNNDFNKYLPDENGEPEKLSIEIPAEQRLNPEKTPSGFDPMGEIQLRGQAYRGLAGGQTPWWILIAGWFVFGAIFAVLLHAAITTRMLTVWILLIIMTIPLLILWRGTVAKRARRNLSDR
jgi:hypothetical protein